MHLLSVCQLAKSYQSRLLFQSLSFGLNKGFCLGIIGDNGSGKSSLLKILAGLDTADSGEVIWRSNLQIFYLSQHPYMTSADTADLHQLSVEMVLEKALKKRLERCGDLHLLPQLSYQIEQAAFTLGLHDMQAKIAHLSGGFRKRLSLAEILLSEPDVVLLDEPSNHLDMENIEWLEKWLHQYQGASILVSHDRFLLDSVAQGMLELRGGEGRFYEGNYADYLVSRAIAEQQQQGAIHRQKQFLKSELLWASKSPKARGTKAKGRLQRIDEAYSNLQQQQQLLTPSRDGFDVSQQRRLGKTIVECKDLGYSVAGKQLFENFSLKLAYGECWGIVGHNGAGKSTLLRLLSQHIQPTSGVIDYGSNSQIAFFSQHESLKNSDVCVERFLTDGSYGVLKNQNDKGSLASFLKRFGFSQAIYNMPMAKLSGGEKNRLSLAKFLLTQANVLLLDEPNNDLDLWTLHHLEETLQQVQGVVLLVSHDRAFLQRLVSGMLVVDKEQKKIHVLQGGYAVYEAFKAAEEEKEANQVKTNNSRAASSSAKDNPKPDHEKQTKKGLTFTESKEYNGLEKKIAAQEASIAAIEEQLSNTELWQTNHRQAQVFTDELLKEKEKLQTIYERWLLLEEKKNNEKK